MKGKLLIYGINNDVGGGKSILENILLSYEKSSVPFKVEAYVPEKNFNEYKEKYRSITFYGHKKYKFLSPLIKAVYTLLFLQIFIKKNRYIAVLNITDLPIPFLKINQYFLFDWPYAVLKDKNIWSLSTFSESSSRRIKKIIFKFLAQSPSTYLVQTKYFCDLLTKQYGIKTWHYFPNCISPSLLNFDSGKFDFLKKQDGINLLVFTAYYTHKNLESIIETIKRLKNKNIAKKINFIFTLNENDKRVRKLLKCIMNESNNMITGINLGVISGVDIFSLYNNCNALFLPTVLESFSGTYVEAIFCSKAVITSELPFAYEILNEDAYYFNPFNPTSIANAILKFLDDFDGDSVLICKNQFFLENSWDSNIKMLNEIIYNELPNLQ